MHVLFYTFSTPGIKGGIEKLIAEISNSLIEKGHQVTILVDSSSDDGFPYFVSPLVNLVYFKFSNSEKFLKKLNLKIKEINPSCIVIMRTGGWSYIQVATSIHGLGIPLMFSEHAAPGIARREFPPRFSRESMFKLPEMIHLLQDSFLSSVPDELREKTRVIPNFVKENGGDSNIEIRRLKKGRKTILMVGRLTKTQKRPMLLLEAFEMIFKKHQNWDLVFVGEGPERESLENFVEEKGMGNRVSLVGQVDDVYRQLRGSDIFCLPSAYEGLPISLLEAMSSGLPCVCFEDAQGMGDLVVESGCGLVAEGIKNVNSLAQKLDELMSDEGLRALHGKKALDYSKNFSEVRVLDLWEKTLLELSKTEVKPNPFLEKHSLQDFNEFFLAEELRSRISSSPGRLERFIKMPLFSLKVLLSYVLRS